MRELIPILDQWISQGEKIAIATVIQTWGSSPRGVGSKMALTPGGKIAGSVSGGCVEGAVAETSMEVLETGTPRAIHFGVADETAWSVGLACGGQIDIFIQMLAEPSYSQIKELLRANQTACLATVVRGPADQVGKQLLIGKEGWIAGEQIPEFDEIVVEKARQAMGEGKSQTFKILDPKPEVVEVFLDVNKPQPLLVIVGGVHIAVAPTSIAATMGFWTVVVDPRQAFGSPERFPHVDQLLQAWPEDAFPQIGVSEQTAIAILTHDPKIDDPALIQALNSPALYIGALGSKTIQARRRKRLLEARIAPEQLGRLHGPIGFDLGGTSPEEIALAIMAEIATFLHAPSPATTQTKAQVEVDPSL